MFGFGPRFIKMINNAHKDTSSCTINGGFSSHYMDIQQGLRQGSPLSPGLFDLVVETLGITIHQNPKIVGIDIDMICHKIHAQ